MSPTTAEPHNVAAWLPELAARQPDSLAVAVARGAGDYHRLDAAALNRLCDRCAHGLLLWGSARAPAPC